MADSVIDPLEQAAAAAGVPPEDVAAYEATAGRCSSGILPPAVWADGAGQTVPPSSAFTAAGVPFGPPITWLQYALVRQAA